MCRIRLKEKCFLGFSRLDLEVFLECFFSVDSGVRLVYFVYKCFS